MSIAPHGRLVRDIVPDDVTTWADLTICYAGHELVYRLRDEADRLLYVGMTWNPKERWKRHRKTKPWWGDVRRAEIECHDSDALALEAEWKAIKTEGPLHNLHGAVH